MERGTRKETFKDYLRGKDTNAVGLADSSKVDNACVARPKRVEDAESIIMGLRRKEFAIVDLSGTNIETSQRILDLLSGAVFALNGSMEKIDDRTFLLMPTGVKINTQTEKNAYDKK